MKKIITCLSVLFTLIANAQVAINTNGASADANTMLDVQSTSKGVKFPRLTTAQRLAIPVTTADAGLFVFDTDKQKLYMYDGNAWTALATTSAKNTVLLTNAAAPQTSKNTLGNAVAIDGQYAVAAARRDTVNGVSDQGSATVFKLINGTWTPQMKLLPSDGNLGKMFGSAVAISNDFIAVANEDLKVGNNLAQGAVYIFKRTGETWSQVDKLVAADGINSAHFGHKVAMQGNILIISADGDKIGNNFSQGSVYVYTYNGAAWVQTQKLLATDGTAYDNFGESISLKDNWLAIGAPWDDVGGVENAGTVHIYVKSGANFIKNQQFASPSPEANEYFGWGVAIKADTVAVSKRTNAVTENIMIFRRPNSNTWNLYQLISAPSRNYDQFEPFGSEMIWYNNSIIVSSPTVEVNENGYQGAIYCFTYTSGYGYQLTKKITDPEGFVYTRFGTSIAMSGDRFIFGSSKHNVFFGTFDE